MRSDSVGACADRGLQGPRDEVDMGAEDVFQVGLHSAQPEQSHAGREVGQQVHIAVGTVLALLASLMRWRREVRSWAARMQV